MASSRASCPGLLRARQDTFYVGTLKGVGRIYQQTFIDTYAKVAFAKTLRPQDADHRGRGCSTTRVRAVL